MKIFYSLLALPLCVASLSFGSSVYTNAYQFGLGFVPVFTTQTEVDQLAAAKPGDILNFDVGMAGKYVGADSVSATFDPGAFTLTLGGAYPPPPSVNLYYSNAPFGGAGYGFTVADGVFKTVVLSVYNAAD